MSNQKQELSKKKEEKKDWKTLKGRKLDEEAIKKYKETRAVWSWRVFKPVVDEEACRRCWLCVDYCPEGVIEKGEKSAEIDYLMCKGCGVCAEECTFKAIKMERER